MPGTATITRVGQVFTTLVLSTSEDTFTFSFPSATNTGPRVQLQFVADVTWLYAFATGGPWYPIGAGVPFDYGPVTHGQVMYVKGAVAGNLYGVVKDGPIPSTRTNS